MGRRRRKLQERTMQPEAGDRLAPARLEMWLTVALSLAACAEPRHATTEGSTMDGLLDVRNVSESIRHSRSNVYAFVANGENIPRWAAGLGSDVQRADGDWIVRGGPLGEVRVRFAPRNDLGVLDHDVTLPTGEIVHNPLRVIPNGSGSTIIFTLLRRAGVSNQQFDDDSQAVQKDLSTLKGLLERP